MLEKFMLVLAGAIILVSGYIWGLESNRDRVLEVLYSEYTHLKMYEDGSYEGERLDDGTPVKGCIKEALCSEE